MKLDALAVFVSVSCGRVTAVVTVPVLPPLQLSGVPAQSGSEVPAGGRTVAVLVMLAAAAAVTVHWICSVAWLPFPGSVTPVQVPVPLVPGAIVPTVKVPADGV